MSARSTSLALRHHLLDAAFFPGRIAIIGATPDADSFAGRLQRNLLVPAFQGEVLFVNPRYQEIDGYRCHAAVEALPDPGSVDVAMIMTSAARAVPLFRACAEAGVKAATIFAAGFGEAGGEGAERVAALQDVLAAHPGVALLGPNTIGTANYRTGAVMLGSANVPPRLTPGALAVVSQSGGMALTFLNKAYARRLPIGLVAHAGNAQDIGLPDYLRYFASRDETSVVALYLEAISQVRELVAAIQEVTAAGKQVLVYRAGRSDAGAQMAASHTGVLTRGTAMVEGILAAAGAVVHGSLEELFETAYAATTCRGLARGGVAVVSASGGANVQAADHADDHAVALARFGDVTQTFLRETYPFASVSNPYDPTGLWRSKPGGLEDCMVKMGEDPAVSAIVFVVPANHASYMDDQVRTVVNTANRSDKQVIVVYMVAGDLTRPHIERILDAGIPVFESLGAAFGAFGRLIAVSMTRLPVDHQPGEPAPAGFAALLQQQPDAAIDEVASKRLLSLYGIPVVAERIVRSAAEAVAQAAASNGPVVLKALVPGLTHKTEAGGVRLNLANADEVAAAFEDLTRPDGQVLLQPMIKDGIELIIGGRRDEHMGPLVVVGLGGIFTELLEDVSCRLAPVTPDEALAMLSELRGRKLLNGYRGAPPVDLAAVAEIIANVSRMLDQQPAIAELDINPVIASDRGAIAVDAAIIRSYPWT